MAALRVLALLAGLAVVVAVLTSAVKSVVLPRPSRSVLTGLTFRFVRALTDGIARRRRSYEARDRVWALVGPLGLILVVFVWLTAVLGGFVLLFWAVDPHAGVGGAFHLSGSSITTLGFAAATSVAEQALAFVEAGLGLLLLTILITYLPSIYAAFTRREMSVALLGVRAGAPPDAVSFLVRYHRIAWLDRLVDEWLDWEKWFVDIQESHSTYPMLAFFRSHDPRQSWVTAAGTVLDAAALWSSVLPGVPRAPAGIMVRSGYLALRHIADFFGIAHDPDPAPTDPISITREEFDGACRRLEDAGLRLVDDRDQAWRDFRGWRVNYDTVLLALAELVHAPFAPWTADRSAPDHRRHSFAAVWAPWWSRHTGPPS